MSKKDQEGVFNDVEALRVQRRILWTAANEGRGEAETVDRVVEAIDALFTALPESGEEGPTPNLGVYVPRRLYVQAMQSVT
jgi:hypothetical protein